MLPFAAVMILSHIVFVGCSPIPPIRQADSPSSQSFSTSDRPQTTWSRQDIFTLVSVCVAVVGIVIGLLIASPKSREWIQEPLKYCTVALRRRRIRQEEDTRRQLQEQYNEYLEFIQFLKIRGSQL
ncbi:hypothetical protein BKA58DRAFT_385841 [Alternaria rosae]|uniref:uncharacterized protein n=1 Tax=Alternaria rosae TaxID=1187941 RepID=UPI001E8D7D17|nr:uncharacterized protein BKA58DRAFT_385841 [Alternaria rosae]KAH6870800.1 hypothetical protein BKA58DRAFT_385841 [Alternaria rosae]